MNDMDTLIKQAKEEAYKYEFMKDFRDFTIEQKNELFKNAEVIRNKKYGNKLFLRASMELSNECENECKYCGMSKKNRVLTRYTVPEEQVKEAILHIKELNIKQLHIVGGESKNIDIEKICNIIKYAKDNGIHTTVVLGEKTKEEYKRMYDAGARRYIIKFETSNEQLFKEYKNSKLEKRIEQLYILREIGYKIGTGIIYGLPKTKMQDVLNDMALIKKISPDMASASAFSPNKQSELSEYPKGNVDETLLFISALRIMLDTTPIISCSSSLGTDGQYKALKAGANLISYHITPEQFIDNFSSYKSEDRIKTKMQKIKDIAKRANMEITQYE